MDSILVGKYEGEYQNGRYHGKGKITFGKNTYEGTFFNGQMHGEGKMTVAGKFHLTGQCPAFYQRQTVNTDSFQNLNTFFVRRGHIQGLLGRRQAGQRMLCLRGRT